MFYILDVTGHILINTLIYITFFTSGWLYGFLCKAVKE
mgnify:CR=1 FL=1